MFGPNTHTNFAINVDFSHRDKEFLALFSDLREAFKKKFSLKDFDILFLNGGGTIAVESLIWSSLNKVNIIGPDGVFFSRWKELSNLHGAEKQGKKQSFLYCQLETSIAEVTEFKGGYVDAISSFPYYDLPECDAFITCANKQLGSIPGLAIVGIKKDKWSDFKDSSAFSYLNIKRYLDYSQINQTPSTPSYPIMMDLLKILNNFDIKKFRERVNINCEILRKKFNFKNSPVLLVPKEQIDEKLAKKWQLYGLNSNSKNYSIFTYSCSSMKYEEFINEMEK